MGEARHTLARHRSENVHWGLLNKHATADVNLLEFDRQTGKSHRISYRFLLFTSIQLQAEANESVQKEITSWRLPQLLTEK